jgi:hypothetical protein
MLLTRSAPADWAGLYLCSLAWVSIGYGALIVCVVPSLFMPRYRPMGVWTLATLMAMPLVFRWGQPRIVGSAASTALSFLPLAVPVVVACYHGWLRARQIQAAPSKGS